MKKKFLQNWGSGRMLFKKINIQGVVFGKLGALTKKYEARVIPEKKVRQLLTEYQDITSVSFDSFHAGVRFACLQLLEFGTVKLEGKDIGDLIEMWDENEPGNETWGEYDKRKEAFVKLFLELIEKENKNEKIHSC